MNSKIIKYFAVVVALIVSFFLGSYVNTFDMDSNESDIRKAKLAKVSLSKAVEKVTNEHSGVVITAILEEKKEIGFVYEIDLINDGQEIELWVDAVTGEMSEPMQD
ncbi:MAG: PepSY domain-containing protein [Pseudomonadota bacterium]